MKRSAKAAFILLLALGFAGMARGQEIRRGNCVVDAEIWTVPECALESRNGQLFVSESYLPLFFSSNHNRLEARMLSGRGWVYFNRHGRVVVENVAPFDNGASDFHHGLVRVVRAGKWGLANSRGSIVVSLKYDGMLEFDGSMNRWKACVGCRVVSGGEHSWFEGGDWYLLDRQGTVVGRATEKKEESQFGQSILHL